VWQHELGQIITEQEHFRAELLERLAESIVRPGRFIEGLALCPSCPATGATPVLKTPPTSDGSGTGSAPQQHPGGRPRDDKEEALEEMDGWGREYLHRHPNARPSDIGRPELIEISGMSPSGLNKRMAEKKINLKKIRARLP
jgi:hypothetical protein